MTSSGREYVRIGLGLTNLTNLVPEVESNGFGWADPAKVRSQAELILKFAVGGDAKMPEVDRLFTNQFVGKIKLTSAELAAARKNAEPFRSFLA